MTRCTIRHVFLAAAASVAACHDSVSPFDAADRVDASWVTGEAAASLDRAGRFDPSRPAGLGVTPEIDYSGARLQAQIWMTDFGPSASTNYLSDERGQKINTADLV